MNVAVVSRLRQVLSDTVLGSSLAGDGLLIRLRSTSIAMLAVVAIVGLGLIAFISQLGWPTVFSGPIPPGPALGVVRNDPIAAPRAPAGPRAHAARAARRAAASRARSTREVATPSTPAPGIAPSRQTGPVAEAPTPVQPTPPNPPAQPAPAPPTDVATTPVVNAEPPASDGGATPKPSGSQGDAPVKSSKGNGHGRGGGGGRDSRADDHGRGHEVRKPKGDEGAQGSAGSEVEPVDDERDSAPEDRGPGSKHGGKGWKAH
jgi:hypothetical protein